MTKQEKMREELDKALAELVTCEDGKSHYIDESNRLYLVSQIIAYLRSEGYGIPTAEDEAVRDKIAESNARGMGLL